MQAETYTRIGKALMPRVRLGKYKKRTEMNRDEGTDQEKLDYLKYFTDSPMN